MIVECVLDPLAYMPERYYANDAGFDLRSPIPSIVPAGGSVLIDTGVHLAIPSGYCGFIKSKSGLNVNFNLRTEGVIDSGYTGSIRIKLFNDSTSDFGIQAGDKIAQIVFLPIPCVTLVPANSLNDTPRGDGGFGSTGR